MFAKLMAWSLLLVLATAIGPRAAATVHADADQDGTEDLLGVGDNETKAGVQEDKEDEDGFVPLTAEEVQLFIEEADSNADGHLSLQELRADLGDENEHENEHLRSEQDSMLREAFDDADTDKDGRLSHEELFQSERFQGALSEDAGEDAAGYRSHDRDPDDGEDTDEDTDEEDLSEFRATLEEVLAYVKEVDTDGDSQVSLAEMTADVKNEMEVDSNMAPTHLQEFELKIMGEAFRSADTNLDGSLSVEEIQDSDNFQNEIFAHEYQEEAGESDEL